MPGVFITGGGGFIGAWVVKECLSRGLEVVVFDVGLPGERWFRIVGEAGHRVRWVQGHLRDRDALIRVVVSQGITQIIHLAALLTPECQSDPWNGCEANVLGTVSVLEAARAAGGAVKGVSYASSVAVFGDEPGGSAGIAGGAGGYGPLTFYGAFKRAVELIAEQYWRAFRIPSTGLRPQVAYGPERVVGLTAGPSLAARAAALGEQYVIPYVGEVGYDYVEDVARAFVCSAIEPKAGAHVLDLPGAVVPVEEVVETLARIVPQSRGRIWAEGVRVPSHRPPAPCWIQQLYPDWVMTPLEEGLRRTVEFYRPRSD